MNNKIIKNRNVSGLLLIKSNSLKLKYLILLTIKNDKIYVIKRTIKFFSTVILKWFKNRKVDATVLAAAGIGNPINLPFSATSTITLNLASLNAPHAINKKDAIHPNLPKDFKVHQYIRIPGATPNETRSHNESYSTPNLLVVFVILATFPSAISKIFANNIATAAWKKFSFKVAIIEYTPQNKFAVVKRFGRT